MGSGVGGSVARCLDRREPCLTLGVDLGLFGSIYTEVVLTVDLLLKLLKFPQQFLVTRL